MRLCLHKNTCRRWARQAREWRSFVTFVQPLKRNFVCCFLLPLLCSLIHKYHRTAIIRKGRGNYSRLVSHTSLLTLQFLWLLSSNWAPDTWWPQLHPTYVPMNKHTWEFSTMWTPCCSMYLLRSPKNSTTSSGVASQGKPLNLTQLRSEPRLAATTHEALDVSGLRKLNWSSCSGLPDLLST